MAYETRRFNFTVTRALQLPLPWAESVKFLILTTIPLVSILTLSSHLRLGLPRGLLPVDLPVKILNVLLPSSVLATCWSCRFDHSDYIRCPVQAMKLLIVKPYPLLILIHFVVLYCSLIQVSDLILKKSGGLQLSALAWGDLEPSYAYVNFSPPLNSVSWRQAAFEWRSV